MCCGRVGTMGDVPNGEPSCDDYVEDAYHKMMMDEMEADYHREMERELNNPYADYVQPPCTCPWHYEVCVCECMNPPWL